MYGRRAAWAVSPAIDREHSSIHEEVLKSDSEILGGCNGDDELEPLPIHSRRHHKA